MQGLIFRQSYDNISSTYTYLLADADTREAVIIDPVFELHQRDLALVKELGLQLLYSLDTHCHADHVTGSWLMKKALGCRIVLSGVYAAKNVDIPAHEGDLIRFGAHHLEVLETPGHTDGCLTYVLEDHRMAFTGDCLMIRGAGRTDFQQGSAHKMFRSIREKIFRLPEDCLIYPAHDYDGRSVSTVTEEKRFNTRLGGSANENDFVGYMKNLNLPHPKKLSIALPANLRSGMPEDGSYPSAAVWGPVETSYDGIPQVSAGWLDAHWPEVTLLDVRDEDEVRRDALTPQKAIQIPLSDLLKRLDEVPRSRPVVTLCRSGMRSAQAVVLMQKNDFKDLANLKGGLLSWNRS